MLYNGRHAKSEKVGGGVGWISNRLGWLLELLTELIIEIYLSNIHHHELTKNISINRKIAKFNRIMLKEFFAEFSKRIGQG